MFNAEILGVNRRTANSSAANAIASTGKTMPWLQDSTQARMWESWGAGYRDVWVLDSSNRLAGVLNLTVNDLGNESNFERMLDMFVAVANSGDSDRDQLPDHWENRYLQGLNRQGDDDSDEDGFSNYLEFALGSDPLDPATYPQLKMGFNASKQFSFTFDRWAGSAVKINTEGSTNLVTWSAGTAMIRTSTVNLYDGSGRSRVTVHHAKSTLFQPKGFTRLGVDLGR